jgi:hypothetical protein
MSQRFAQIMGVLRATINTPKKIYCRAPGNKFTRSVLIKFRENGYISGFCISLNSVQEKIKDLRKSEWNGYPQIAIFLNKDLDTGLSVFKLLRLYPRTNSNYHNIKINRIYKIYYGNQRKSENALITTSKGLIWAQDYVYNKQLGKNRMGGGLLIIDITLQ